jgi:biotin transport system substrate-specific component
VVTELDYVGATIASVQFLPGDILKVVAAASIAMTLRRSYPLMPAPVRA